MNRLLLAACVMGLGLVPSALEAQVSIGPQGSWGDRRDWAVGGRLTVDFSPNGPPVAFVGSYDWFFPQVPVGINAEYWEINVNAVYVQTLYQAEAVSYVGLGLNVADWKAEGQSITGEPIAPEDDTVYGLNLVGGTRYKFERFAPFFELRYIIEGGEQFVITAGLELIFGSGYY
jgi:hypothetical protein